MELWVNTVGFGLVVSLLLFLLNRMFSLQKEVGQVASKTTDQLTEFQKNIEEFMDKERHEGVVAHQRIDVLDVTLGDLTDEKFQSKLVAEGVQPYPSLRRLRRQLDRSGS